MSTEQNNSQTDASKEGQDPTNAGQDSKATENSKEFNFEKLRKQSEDKDRIIAKFEKERSDSEKAKLEEKGETQKLLDIANKEKEEILTKYQTEKRQALLEKELAKSGINAELVDLILPSIAAQIEFDDSNNPKNLSEVVAELKTSKPSLFAEIKAGPAGKVGAGVANNSNSSNFLSEAEIEKIVSSGNAQLIEANKEKILANLPQQ